MLRTWRTERQIHGHRCCKLVNKQRYSHDYSKCTMNRLRPSSVNRCFTFPKVQVNQEPTGVSVSSILPEHNAENICSFLIFAVLLTSFIIYVSLQHPLPVVVHVTRDGPEAKTEEKRVDWKNFDVSIMTPAQILAYYKWGNCSSCQLFQDFGGILGSNKVIDGQKSICLDQGVAPQPGKCVVYSVGINNEWSFDDMMERYGCSVYAFDPSMKVADHDRTEKIHFLRMGLSGQDQDKDSNGWKLKTLSSIYEMLKPHHGDVVIDYLKVDIEWAEWGVIPQIIESGMLDNIRQMGFEIHLKSGHSLEEQRKYVAIIKSIEDHGMVRFASRINPVTNRHFAMGIDGYFGYEIAWYNSKFLPR